MIECYLFCATCFCGPVFGWSCFFCHTLVMCLTGRMWLVFVCVGTCVHHACVCVCVCVVCACGENVGGGLAPYTDRDSLMRHTVHLQCGDADGGAGG